MTGELQPATIWSSSAAILPIMVEVTDLARLVLPNPEQKEQCSVQSPPNAGVSVTLVSAASDHVTAKYL